MSGYEVIANATTPEQAIEGIKRANSPEIAMCFVARLHQLTAQEQAQEAQRAGDQMLTYTRRMTCLTVFVTVLTIINVALVAYTILCPATL
jgi:hypothetical protein